MPVSVTTACSVEGGSLGRPEESVRLERALGHRFARLELLERALTHASRAHEQDVASNERLEFLGDAVLDLVVSDLLMEADPIADEGQLSRARAQLVNTGSLAERARRLELDQHLRLGKSEERSDGHEKPSILANVFEAVLGALYVDSASSRRSCVAEPRRRAIRSRACRSFCTARVRVGRPSMRRPANTGLPTSASSASRCVWATGSCRCRVI